MQLQSLFLLALSSIATASLNVNPEHLHQEYVRLLSPNAPPFQNHDPTQSVSSSIQLSEVEQAKREVEAAKLEERQLAAGGGVAATTLAASQYPIASTAGSLFTINGVTSATWTLFVQTFATTALGTWELGPTPGVGTIGLGSIPGTVGGVKTKRAVETSAPQASWGRMGDRKL
ncbi:uncharacterized protein L3040_000547 [Drepanopeziza brunnea f. sp. 'multigermtubi']|uniref:Uncharacterized protein n=1 Tax=Marssonina brunnea f. sp. multigermtubi (strain MB_m1) TaxID=1072389 RepID=K1X4X3_MARBU|nr:uncharacterized protein MBM_02168 [Drepanopeziza brunnea f. sp. 'multigermtubi' MB_m1]EKD20216.1 hypothetical protein MBM_02168 [Drepanopeziza brunnea f. sp. 'multigermtubi' MB_m1]KAJ5054268.1 hypothetical protein L3040_000547 [Drepanopeziza brunnea f. sp. 'multigermtubi']